MREKGLSVKGVPKPLPDERCCRPVLERVPGRGSLGERGGEIRVALREPLGGGSGE